MADDRINTELERFCELRQNACCVRIEIAEVRKELEGNKRAMELAAESLSLRLESMNEVRSQLNRQALETIRREEVVLMMEKHNETFGLQIKALEQIVSDVRERENKVILMLGVALFALAGNFALQLLLHLSRH